MKARPAAPITAKGPLRSSFRALLALLPTTGTTAPAGFRAPTPSRRAGRVPAPRAVLCGVAAAALLLGATSASADPLPTVNPVTEHTITTAHLSGQIATDEAPETYWVFQYRPVLEGEAAANQGPEDNWASGPFSAPLGPESTNPVEETLTGLNAQTEYEIRLLAFPLTAFFFDPAPGTPGPAFTTDPAANAPALALEPPTPSYLSAQIQGTVDPEGGNLNGPGEPVPIHWAIELSESGEPGTFSPVAEGDISGAEAEESNPIPVPAAPAEPGLTQNTTYHYRLRATYAGQQVLTPDATFTTLPVAAPAVSIEPIATFTATSAHLTGTVNPEGADPAFNSSCRFDYVTDTGWVEGGETFALATPIPCEPETVEGAGSQEVKADLTGLTPHTTYHVRLVASNAGGTSEAVAAETLTTKVQIPLISDTSAANVTSTSADLRALINPGNGATTYHFEYGTTSAYGQSSPESGSIGSDNASHPAALHIAGLQPETTYHYRVLATNSAAPIGGTPGPDRTFTTQPATSSTALPDGRQWELVSPPDKHGAEVENKLFEFGGIMQAAEDGSAVSYVTNSPIDGNTKNNPLENQVFSRRVPGGWSSQGIATPHAGASGREYSESGGSGFPRLAEISEYLVFSPDLSLAFVQPEAYTPLAPPAPAPKSVEGVYDSAYVRDNNTGTFSITELNSKEWYDEQLALSQPPPKCDASSSPVGATVGTEGVQAVSQDGCYVYFNSAAGAGPLEVAHYDGAAWTTTLVSSLLDPGDIKWVEGGGSRLAPFAELSPNGRYLTFMSRLSLTGYDNTDANSPVGEPRADWEVFLYDAATDSLTCASCDPTGARPVGKFDPGRTGTDGQLQVDAASYFQGSWLAGLLAPFPVDYQLGNSFTTEPILTHRPRYLTDSGELFFESPLALVPRDVNGTWDVYEYRPQGTGGCTKEAGCDALISSGQSKNESVLIEISADGSDVFFFTSQRLTGQDIDHVNDVYDAHVCSAQVPCPPPPPPPAPACEGDACQQPATPPSHPTPASRSYSGPENEHPAKPKKKHPKKHKHHKAKKTHSKRSANHNRRGGK